MHSNIGLLIKKELEFLFRPGFIAFLIIFSILFYPLRFIIGIWGAFSLPMVFGSIFSLSGCVKGYTSQKTGFLMAPFTRKEYIQAKYIFSALMNLVVWGLAFVTDLLLIFFIKQLKPDWDSFFTEFNIKSLVTVYCVLMIVNFTAQALVLFSSSCSKINYSVSIVAPFVILILATNILGNTWHGIDLTGLLEKTALPAPIHLILMLSAAGALAFSLLYFSYKKCVKGFHKYDF